MTNLKTVEDALSEAIEDMKKKKESGNSEKQNKKDECNNKRFF